jgi:cytosine permease
MAETTSLFDQLDAVEEYERSPVPESEVKDFKSFVNMVVGEHIAGTEFVIGPLFVLHGVSAWSVFIGLFIGNLLATLSWTLICAPIAVKTRLTTFYQLEKICGYRLVTVFNAINGLQFCVLSASMIAVSATAVGLVTDMPMPGMTDILPNSFTWIVLSLAIGSVITFVSIFGYDRVAQFSGIFAPWMPLVFVAAAVAVMPQLGIQSIGDFWQIANQKIWTGVPTAGNSHYTVWHIIFFSWLCNTAMHIGLSDMSIYRYAKKAHYGLASAVGMFIGHGMAWLASGVLCAVALQNGNSNPSPGQIAYDSAGLAGAFCVVVAGWTTANPTIYRAGLALKGIFPNTKRWKLTLFIGSLASVLACFPGVISKLDQVLAFYALVAAPVGAVILLDVYFFKKWGLTPNYAEATGSQFNWAVALTWLLAMLTSYVLYVVTASDFFFFMAIPGWCIAAILYYLLSKSLQKNVN